MRLTYEALQQLPDDGLRHELIDGEHHVTPSPNLRHQGIAGSIYFFIRAHVTRVGAGRVYIAPTDVLFSDVDVVVPDVLYVSQARVAILEDRFVRGAPDLVVEVGSPSTRRRDLREKLGLYDRWGVLEYWFVDPDISAVIVYRRELDRLARARELSLASRDTLTSPLLPGLQIPLAEVFEG